MKVYRINVDVTPRQAELVESDEICSDEVTAIDREFQASKDDIDRIIRQLVAEARRM